MLKIRKYKVTLYPYLETQEVYKVEADSLDNAIKEACKLEGIEYISNHKPCCIAERIED